MTNNNFKNNKTKTATAITASLVIGLIMLSPMTIFPSANALSSVTHSTSTSKIPSQILTQNFPSKLSEADLGKLKQIVLADPEVQKAIGEKPYEFMAQDFVGNFKTAPGVWYPEIHINVNNKTEISVTADLTEKSVRESTTHNLIKSHSYAAAKGSNSNAAMAVDEYDGTYNIDGIYMNTVAPHFSASSPPYVEFLVNGLESGGTDADACTSSDYYDDYWAQAGLDFYDEIGSYTDTTYSCAMQTTNDLSYNSEDSYVFYIQAIPADSYWKVYGADTTSGSQFTYYGPAINNINMQTSDVNTSVWLENHETTTGWSSDFSPESVNATNALVYSSSSWYDWDDDYHVDLTCSGGSASDSIIESGTDLQNGDTAVWNMHSMDNNLHC